MSTVKYLLDAQATLQNGELVIGPVTTRDDESYLFVNRHSILDFYLEMKKGPNGWFQSAGPSIQHRQSIVDELGHQIDTFIIQNPKLNTINLPDH